MCTACVEVSILTINGLFVVYKVDSSSSPSLYSVLSHVRVESSSASEGQYINNLHVVVCDYEKHIPYGW